MNKIIIATILPVVTMVLLLTAGCSVDRGLPFEPDESEEVTDSELEYKISTDIEERIKNCKIMRVFQMSFEEVLNILGEPDETIWLAGDVYIWNDASVLIGNNEDGLSEQKELLIGGESIKAINFEEFGDIKIGMSFHDAQEILGAKLETFDTEGSEWFQYAMVYEYEEYSIIFESTDSTSPVRMIMVWRF